MAETVALREAGVRPWKIKYAGDQTSIERGNMMGEETSLNPYNPNSKKNDTSQRELFFCNPGYLVTLGIENG